MKTIILLSLFALLFSSVAAINGKCRALCLEGGGDLGAYEAGAISGLVQAITELYGPEERSWDVITGVSVGAMNTLGMSFFEIGQEEAGVDYILNLWRQITAKQVYKNWPGGIIEGVLYQPGIYNNQPLKDLLHELRQGHEVSRPVEIGVVDANKGLFVNFDESLGTDNFVTMVIGSASMPAAFPYLKVNGTIYIDGGSIMNLDVPAGINRCLDMGYEEKDIIIDAIFCTGRGMNTDVVTDKYNAMSMLARYLQIHAYEGAMNYITFPQHDYPDVTFRYVVAPVKDLEKSQVPLKFDLTATNRMIFEGQRDALAAVKAGLGVNLANLKTYHKLIKNKDFTATYEEFLQTASPAN